MPGKQRGKMELPAGNANRRRFMCGGESHGGSKRKKLAGGGASGVAKDVAKTAARSYYKAKTMPLQVLDKGLKIVAPGSKAETTVDKVANPAILKSKGGGVKKAKKRG